MDIQPGGDQRVLEFLFSSGVTHHTTRVYVKTVPMFAIDPPAMSNTMKTMKGPVAPVVERLTTEFARAIKEAAATSVPYTSVTPDLICAWAMLHTFCITPKYHALVLNNWKV